MCWIAILGILPLRADTIDAPQGYSDPVRPSKSQRASGQTDVPFYKIGSRLKKVEQEITKEVEALDSLVPLQPAKQFDAFGYHSDYLPTVEGVPDRPLWYLDLDVNLRNRRIVGVVLVPTIDERTAQLRGYAFPKRFRILSVDSDGTPGEVYVDWTAQDFLIPGCDLWFSSSLHSMLRTLMKCRVKACESRFLPEKRKMDWSIFPWLGSI